MSKRTCPGCGAKIVGDPRRKWCSERCRKGSYGDPCIDCGARTTFGAESARVPEPRCLSCAASRKHAVKYGPQRERLAQLYRDGLSFKEIAAELGWSVQAVSSRMVALRDLGYDIPYRVPKRAAVWAERRAA
jgi:hypothetical protein